MSGSGHIEECRLFHIVDRTTGQKFLVDTGAQRSLTVNLGLRRTFRWIFAIAEVRSAILGADFLTKHGHPVDVKRRRLLDATILLSVQGVVATAAADVAPSCATAAEEPFAALLKEFPTVTSPHDWTQPVNHDVRHHITTTGPPVFFCPRRLAPDRPKIARAEFEHMLELGVERPSSSRYASPLHMVPKKNAAHGVVTNATNSEFGVPALDFLGHRLDATGIRPLSNKVQAILDFPTPTSVTKLRQVLGLVNFYRRFIRNCATLLEPLDHLLSGKRSTTELD
ncbi:uncharacterized protein LOC144175416 [Haemaphysalis longicornis]